MEITEYMLTFVFRTQKMISEILCLIFACVLIVFSASASLGQTTTQPAATSQASSVMQTTTQAVRSLGLTIDGIQKRIKQAETIADEAQRKNVVDIYQQALVAVQKANEWEERRNHLKAERETAQTQIDEIKSKLAGAAEASTPAVPANTTLAQLEQNLAQLQADQDTTEKLKGTLDTKLKILLDRRIKLPEIAAQAKQKLADIQKNLKFPSATDTTNDLVQANWILNLAQAKVLYMESQCYDEELLGYEIRMMLLRAQIDQANHDLLVSQKMLSAWRELVSNFRRQEAERTATQARREAEAALPAVKHLAEENAQLAERLCGSDGLAAQIETVTIKNDEIEQQLNKLKDRFKNIQTTVDKAGVTDAISLLLRKERTNLPKVNQFHKLRKDIENKMADAHFQLVLLEEERADLTDMDSLLNKILVSVPSLRTKNEYDTVRQSAIDKLQTKKIYLSNLIDSYDSYIEKLADLDTNTKDLVAETSAFAAYIDEHIFWFQSTSPLGLRYIVKTWDAIRWITNPYAWYTVFHALWLDSAANAGRVSFLALCIFVLIVLNRFFLHRLQHTGQIISDEKENPHWQTIRAFVYTLLMASGWPLLLWFIGWRLEVCDHISEFARALSAGFVGSALLLFTFNLIVKVCLPDGLADKHFRWDSENLKIIRKNVSWLTLIALPSMFLTLAMEVQDNEFRTDSLGRVAFMILIAAFGICIWKIAGPSPSAIKLPENFLGRLKYFWYPLFFIPPILVVIAGLGFYYTATQLGWKMLATLWLLLLLLFVQEMILRWLYLAERKIAIDKTEQLKNETSQKKKATLLEKFQDSELNFFKIGLQNKKLIRSIVGFILAIGLWFIWADVLPALGILKQINLWEKVTLAGFLLAILITIMTFIAGKNLPGLLEVVVLHRLPLDAGSRFAVTTLCRYVIIVFGIAVAFDIVGIDWQKIQWLIAAITVGLGFGLQEIFANFVSGLIILFERPIRVGDIVTVDDITGTVTRIHIRATTITDWDRKELIVPNKEFITGRVVNWTLSDRIIRLLIKVGVAYGTDTDLVQKLLLEAAKSLPAILSDPPPSAIFTGFGESSLDFEIRAYIPNVDNQLTLKHELFTAINKKLQQAGIEIPFPQRDIHVRTLKIEK
jgi:potassium efflux system protein